MEGYQQQHMHRQLAICWNYIWKLSHNIVCNCLRELGSCVGLSGNIVLLHVCRNNPCLKEAQCTAGITDVLFTSSTVEMACLLYVWQSWRVYLDAGSGALIHLVVLMNKIHDTHQMQAKQRFQRELLLRNAIHSSWVGRVIISTILPSGRFIVPKPSYD
jgi:hypothetical protein